MGRRYFGFPLGGGVSRGVSPVSAAAVAGGDISVVHGYSGATAISNDAVDHAMYSSGVVTETPGMVFRISALVKYTCVTGPTLLSVGMKRAAAGTTLVLMDTTVQNQVNKVLVIELQAMVDGLNSINAGSTVIDQGPATPLVWADAQRNQIIGGGTWSPLFLTLQWGAANVGNVMNPLCGWWEVVSPALYN